MTEKVLGIDTQCYTDPLDRDGGKCINGERSIIWTRGKVFGLDRNTTADNAFASYDPTKIPYVIPPEYQWGPGRKLDMPRDVYDFLLGPESVVKEIRERWMELVRERDYEKAMRIADEIIEEMKTGSYRGVPYLKVSLLQAARAEGLTAEEVSLNFDTAWEPERIYFSRTNLLDLGRLWIRFVALSSDPVEGVSEMVTPVATRDGKRRRIGMGSIAKKLQRLVEKGGVRIFYKYKATTVRRCHQFYGGDVCISFQNGKKIQSSRVFLNLGKSDLIALGVDSEPFRGSNLAFKRAVEGLEVFGLTKTYCFWDDAWWMNALKQSRGRARSHGQDIYQTTYHDGHVVCEDSKSLEKCRGGLLVSYVYGDSTGASSGIYAHSYNEIPHTPLTNDDNIRRIVRDNSSSPSQLYMQDLHRQLKVVHASSFRSLGYPDIDKAIPPPSACVYADWKEIGIHMAAGPQRQVGVDEYKLFVRPIKDLRIHLVGEAWGQDRGWAEASVNSAERVLHHDLKLDKPKWMDDAFHGSVIRYFNGGTT